jgi:SAM-dependent methyltransferase
MGIVLRAAYQDLTFMTPLSQGRAGKLVDFLATGLDGTVLDAGCGWAELLLRVVAAAPTCRGVGIDSDARSISYGQQLAEQRRLTRRVTLIHGDARTAGPEQVDALICIGSSQIWGPPVADNQPLDYDSTLTALRAKVRRGARVVYGEGIWSRPPTAAAAAPLSGRLDELRTLAELVDLAVARGFMPVAVHEATTDEWDEFESGYSACYARWLAEHGLDHPDANEVLAMAHRQRTGYLSGYRNIMGLAYLALLAV